MFLFHVFGEANKSVKNKLIRSIFDVIRLISAARIKYESFFFVSVLQIIEKVY